MFQVGVLFNIHYRRYPDLPLRKITVSGIQYSLAPGATTLLIGSSTLPLTAEESTYTENSLSSLDSRANPLTWLTNHRIWHKVLPRSKSHGPTNRK